MKQADYSLTSRFMWCIVSLLALSCSDDSGEHENQGPSPSYNLVSVEYAILESLPLRERFSSKEYGNYSNAEITYISGDEEFPVNSYFLLPSRYPEDAAYFEEIEVPIPELDASGNIIGMSDLEFPLAFVKTQTANVEVKDPQTVVIPPLTTYRRVSYYVGWHVSAQYTCILEDSGTKDKIAIEGNWMGDVCYKQEIQIIDNQNNVIQQYEHSVIY